MSFFKRKYFLHLFSSYIQLFIGILIAILLTPYMISKLGEELYGYWILLNSILIYLNLSNLGFGTTLLKEASHINDISLLNKYISTMFFFFLVIVFCILLLSFYFIDYLDTVFLIPSELLSMAKTTFIIFIMTFFISFMSSIFKTILFAKGYFHIQAFIGTVQALFSAFFIAFILSINYSIVEISLVNLIITIFFSFIMYLTTKVYVPFHISFQYFDFDILKKMFSPSIHYFIVAATATIILYSDNIIISSFIGLSSVAIYAIGYKVVDLSQKILFKVVDVMIPDIAKLYAEKEYHTIYRLHNKVLLYSIVLGVLGYGFLFIFGIDIIELWVGKQYTLDSSIFNVFVTFGLWHTWVHVSAVFNVAIGNHKLPSYMGMANAILNIALSIILLKFYGLLGVALGTLISHIVTNGWFTNYWFYKTIHIKVQNKVEKENEQF